MILLILLAQGMNCNSNILEDHRTRMYFLSGNNHQASSQNSQCKKSWKKKANNEWKNSWKGECWNI